MIFCYVQLGHYVLIDENTDIGDTIRSDPQPNHYNPISNTTINLEK